MNLQNLNINLMESSRYDRIMRSMFYHYHYIECLGYNVVGIFLYGSQNYKMDTVTSDIDTKAIVLPKLDDVILNRQPISKTITMPNNSQCDVKDIREMFKNFKKQNINFLEILFTDFWISGVKYDNIVEKLQSNRELIARYNNYAMVSGIVGMMNNKYKMMEHIAPSTKKAIEKYGYDPKQFHHTMRLYDFLKRYISTDTTFKNLLIPENIDEIMSYKTNPISLEEARIKSEAIINDANNIKLNYFSEYPIKINKSVEILFDDIASTAIKNSFKEELLNEHN